MKPRHICAVYRQAASIRLSSIRKRIANPERGFSQMPSRLSVQRALKGDTWPDEVEGVSLQDSNILITVTTKGDAQHRRISPRGLTPMRSCANSRL